MVHLENLGPRQQRFTNSLKMNKTGSSIFVDPDYGTGGSIILLLRRLQSAAGTAGNNVSGKVAIGRQLLHLVLALLQWLEFEETLSPYLTNNGGLMVKAL